MNRPAADATALVAITVLCRRPPVLATGRSKSPPRRPGQAMTTFNRIFTTQRLLQIIAILAATVAMKLMS